MIRLLTRKCFDFRFVWITLRFLVIIQQVNLTYEHLQPVHTTPSAGFFAWVKEHEHTTSCLIGKTLFGVTHFSDKANSEIG